METVERLINEIGKIKTQMNSTELQLYEANEKIAELSENVRPILLVSISDSSVYEHDFYVYIVFSFSPLSPPPSLSLCLSKTAPAFEGGKRKSQSGKFESNQSRQTNDKQHERKHGHQ